MKLANNFYNSHAPMRKYNGNDTILYHRSPGKYILFTTIKLRNNGAKKGIDCFIQLVRAFPRIKSESDARIPLLHNALTINRTINIHNNEAYANKLLYIFYRTFLSLSVSNPCLSSFIIHVT